MSQRQIKRWVDAGLLSAAQGETILAYEAAHRRPWLHWAVLGIGGLAIFLGIAALVASNWFAIPGGVKLAVHLAFNIAAAFAVVRAWRLSQPLWIDLTVFLFAGLLLTAIVLTGQVFQLSSPLWRPLAFWTAIATPILMLAGQGRLSALAWAAGFLGAVFSYTTSLTGDLSTQALLWALPGSAASILTAVGFLGRRYNTRTNYWVGLSDMGFGLAIALASFAAAGIWGYATAASQQNFAASFWRASPALLATAVFAAWCIWRRRPAERPKIWLLTASFIATALPATIPLHGVAEHTAAAVLFMALWACVTWVCIRSSRPGLARIAVGVIALRLIAIYFEVFGSLAMTGIGLIVSGIAIIALTTVTVKLMKRLPPGQARS